MEDIPSEQLFGDFPEQTGEEGRLESSLKMDLSIGNDLVDQEEHPEREEEGEEVFQRESEDRSQVQERG